MDPCRIRSYLQVACAGLGFEIGEIWWTSNEHGSSTVAAIEEKPSENTDQNGAIVPAGSGRKSGTKLRFVQLYTSKSYANRRSMLVTPPEDDEDDDSYNDPMAHHHHHDHECTQDDLEKHKLSPRLVDAISKTAQVVWANTVKQEGLTGRSDIPLHTAVGMPVALDAEGNMCVVVMFSPNNIQSTDEAMEYLQSISRSATSSSIPCLMPAFDRTEDIQHVPTSSQRSRAIQGHIMPQETNLGEGVTARFVSIDDSNSGDSTPEQMSGHDLASAPKDCFGIPMLPSFAELGNESAAHPVNTEQAPPLEDVFDEASYGVWSTIMQERPALVPSPAHAGPEDEDIDMAVENGIPMGLNEGINPAHDDGIDPKSLVTHNKRTMERKRKERLEEFCTAFLGMSVFDIADVWIPAGPEHPDCLSHVMSISSSNQSNAVTEFKRVSGYTLIKFWSGAVGRAYSSGNPVWSCNPDVYIDKGRSHVFERANIMTAFAVPIVSGKNATPVGVVCCYSMIQSGSVPFVLKFVQQAIHLLWSGLDKVQPHESVGRQMWQDVGPADLGEMAADVEMQHHFLNKKRPRSTYETQPAAPDQSAPLASQLKKIDFHREDLHDYATDISDAYNEPEQIPEFYNFQPRHTQHDKPPEQRHSVQAIQAFQNHIKEAVRQVGEALPFTHNHVATTEDGRKRAHVVSHESHGHGQHSSINHHHPAPVPRPPRQPAPLSMPHALPTRVVKNPHHAYSSAPTIHELSPKLMDATPPPPVNNNMAYLSQEPPTPPLYAPAPQHENPPHSYQQNHSYHQNQSYQQSHLQPIHVHDIAPPVHTHTGGPSQLSQNLLSQGMLESIANQQFSTQYDSAPTHGSQHEDTSIHYTPTPIAPTSVEVTGPPMDPNTVPLQPPQVQTNGAYCMPTSSTYPTPDAANSGAEFSDAPTGKVKLCRIQGCDDPAVIRRPYCARHSGNRLCEHNGCNKCAQGSTRFCIAHGGGRRCTFPGCDKGARDKFFCAAHGGGKRCKADGCNKSAVGGSSLCTAHGGGRRCAIDGCDKSAQSSTKYCVKHGGGKKCCQEGCEKVARGRTQYCAAHGGGVRCKLDGCNRVAIGKMQLCRAHGGGSRARAKSQPRAPLPPPMPASPPMYAGGGGMPSMAAPQMEYPTPTSV